MLILRTWSLMEGHVARLLSASPSRLMNPQGPSAVLPGGLLVLSPDG